MSRTCPHCNHVRRPHDQAPDWQCPSCERAYEKPARAVESAEVVTSRQSGGGAWLLLALLLVVGLFAGRVLWPPTKAQASTVSVRAPQPVVELYATSWCPYCQQTREFFAANAIEYIEHDIEKSSQALAEHEKLGGKGVPLILVGDEVIRGYNESSLRTLLRPWLRSS